MGADIESLDIRIEANAKSANSSIDTLVSKLEKLSTSLGSVNGNNITSLSNGVQRLSGSMQTMKSVGTADFSRLARNISKMGEIDADNIGMAASSLHRFTNALSQLDAVNISDNVEQIGTIANGIRQLGYKSAEKAIGNIPKLATAMKQLMTTLSGVPKVSQNLIDMTNALAKLSRTGTSSGRAATSLGKALDTYTASTGRASNGTFSLASAIGKLYATYWMLFRAFGKIGDAIDISSDLTEVQNVVDVTFGNMAYKVEELAKTSIEQFGMSELALKQYASRFQAIGSAMGIDKNLIANANFFLSGQTDGYISLSDSMSDVSLNLTKLTADMASFYNVEQKDVAEDLSAIFTGMTRPLRQYGLDLTEATLKEWAMKNGLDANIDSMTQAEKTMLRYQYVLANTGAAQGDFARTSDTWANQVRILKQNFQQLASVIGGVFINALKPLVKALNAAMSHIIAFAKTISNAIGKIFGWKYEGGSGGFTSDFEDVAGSTGDIEDNLSGAANSAKKMRSYLLGIDELNVIDPDETSSSGGSGISGIGGAGGGTDGGWVKTDSIFKDFESDIDTLYELGEYIGKAITDALNSIDWESVYEGARNFGKGLAEFLNGLISPELFGAVGRTIAGALNTAIYAALSFGETFDFYDFGVSIATGINEFFRTFDFTSLAQTLNVWVDGFKDFVSGFLKTISWKDILEGAADFLGELEIDTVAVIIGGFTLNYLGKLLSADVLKDTLLKKFTDIAKEAGLSTGVATLGTALFTIEVVLTLEQFMSDFQEWKSNIEEYGWEEGRRKTAKENSANPYIDDSEYNKNIDSMNQKWNDFWENVRKTTNENDANPYVKDSEYNKNLDNMTERWNTLRKNLAKENLANPYVETSNYKQNIEEIKLGWQNLKAKLSEKWDGMGDWFTNNISPWFSEDKWAELWENVKLAASRKWNEIVEWWNSTAVVTWWNESVVPWFSLETWYELAEGILIGMQTKWSEIVDWWQNTAIYTWWTENVAPWFAVEKWSTMLNNIKTSFYTKWNETVVQWITNITKWWKENVAPWFTIKRWSEMLNSIPDSFKSAFKAAANGAISFLNGVIEGVENLVNQALSGLKKLTDQISKIPGVNLSFEVSSISLPRIPEFEVGGFPEDGLFFANHSELVGKFSNGRTAVANNEMIVAGIEEAAYRGFARANAENTREVALLEELILAVREGKSITIDGRELVAAYDERKSRNGYSFA